MTKIDRVKEAADAIKVGRFVLWSRSLKDIQGVPLINAEIRLLCEAAGEFIVRTLEESAERRRSASEKGKKGGRPRKDVNGKGSKLRRAIKKNK